MWPPEGERERLITASCWRSSRIWILTSSSTMDANAPPRVHDTSVAEDGKVFGGARGFAFAGAVFADGSGGGPGRRELDQVFAREAGIAEAARLRLGRLVHPLLRE